MDADKWLTFWRLRVYYDAIDLKRLIRKALVQTLNTMANCLYINLVRREFDSKRTQNAAITKSTMIDPIQSPINFYCIIERIMNHDNKIYLEYIRFKMDNMTEAHIHPCHLRKKRKPHTYTYRLYIVQNDGHAL